MVTAPPLMNEVSPSIWIRLGSCIPILCINSHRISLIIAHWSHYLWFLETMPRRPTARLVLFRGPPSQNCPSIVIRRYFKGNLNPYMSTCHTQTNFTRPLTASPAMRDVEKMFNSIWKPLKTVENRCIQRASILDDLKRHLIIVAEWRGSEPREMVIKCWSSNSKTRLWLYVPRRHFKYLSSSRSLRWKKKLNTFE